MDWISIAVSLGLLLAAVGALGMYLRKVATGDLSRLVPLTRSARPVAFWFTAVCSLAVIGFFCWYFAGLLLSHVRDGFAG
jgi:hypothetical protein